MSISPIQSLPPIEGATKLVEKPAPEVSDVGEGFGKALKDARALDKDATQQAEAFANHDPNVGIHEVVIASEKASIAVRYATTLKNKALEAYHELMNTQV
jgi:flagellar hook-basal body complex protein FliE